MMEESASDRVVERAATLVPDMRKRAALLDANATFPTEDLAALRAVGALAVTDLSTDHLVSLLTSVGSGNLSVGRLFEAHVNALHLMAKYGTLSQRDDARRSACRGELHALWVTDPPEGQLRMIRDSNGWYLSGKKMFCSGAGGVDRALITAETETGEQQMILVRLGQGEKVEKLPGQLQGMRAAVTGAVDFTGVTVTHDAVLGQAGDYLREPDFSCGAWRGSAVAYGGLCALLDASTEDLARRYRIDQPNQLTRLGRAMIARETSRLWVRDAAHIAEAPEADPREAISYVGLARIAVETACLEAMCLVQRSMGLTSFRQGQPVELICRDLATYLRQPAPDAVLNEAAMWFANRGSVCSS